MLYIILTILFSTAFSLIMKHAHARGYDVWAVGCVNYIMAGLAALFWASFQSSGKLPTLAVLIGCVGGAMYVLCYLCIMVMLERQGISVATALTRLAIAVPIIASVLFWNETPNVSQIVGLALTGAAILLFDFRDESSTHKGLWHVIWPLAGCFLTAGGARLCQKAFGEYCQPSERPIYIAAWFVFAGVISFLALLVRRAGPSSRDMSLGTLLGLINVATLFSIITALRILPAIIVFPVTAVGSLMLVVLLAAWVWREDLLTRTRWGLVLASLALILVNLS